VLYDSDAETQYLLERRGRYSYTLVTAPAKEPVAIEEAKAHLRIDSSAEDITILQPSIKAARVYAENRLSRQFITATWDLRLDYFPAYCDGSRLADYAQFNSILIGKCPVQSVTSVKYIDTSGVEQTLATSEYTVDVHDEPARITPAFGKAWPTARNQPNAVTVRFVAGYGDDETSIPESLRTWLKLAVGTLFENREMDAATALKRLEFADCLLESESWGDYP